MRGRVFFLVLYALSLDDHRLLTELRDQGLESDDGDVEELAVKVGPAQINQKYVGSYAKTRSYQRFN